MAGEVGKLDGLRDIIHPPEPAANDNLLLIGFVLLLMLAGLLYYLYRRFQQGRLYKARSGFKLLQKNRHRWTARQCGESIMGILRLYAGSHNLRYQQPYGLDEKEWTTLLACCNQLRFSDAEPSEDLLTMPLALIEHILWQRR